MTQGERLKQLRKEYLHLTLEKFGEKIGMKKSSLSQIENGINSLTMQTTLLICSEYNVNYDWLTSGVGEVFSDDNSAILEKVDKILKNENEFHKNIIKTFVNLDENELFALERILDRFLALSEPERKQLDEDEFVKEELSKYEAELRSSFRARTSLVSRNTKEGTNKNIG